MVKISAGSYDLNTFLYGGYETDIVSVLYGGPGTGKTNFCLMAAVSQAKKGNRVIFIDSEGGFSTERIKQLAGEDYDKVLTNIFLLKPTNFSEQKKSFEELLKYLKEEVSLIVVDGMTILYRLELAEAHSKSEHAVHAVNSDLVKQITILAEIARKRGICVLITNQVYTWQDEEKMVGGDILKYWAKCHLEIVKHDGKRTLYLKKHRSLPEKSFDFFITNNGIRKKGWI